MKSRLLLCFVGQLVVLAGCQYDPYTWSYAKTEPTRQHIVGSWLATKDSLDRLHLQLTPAPRLVIGEDGSIIMTHVPTGWRGMSLDVGETVEDFAGGWNLERHQDVWWGLSIRQGEWGCFGCLMVMHNKAPHLLVLRYSDPDEGLGLEFERAVEQEDAPDEARKEDGP